MTRRGAGDRPEAAISNGRDERAGTTLRPVTAPVFFYFDFISPYAHVAWKATRGRGFTPVPVLFAAMLNANGQKGPAEIPSKRGYAFKDAYRKAVKLGLPGISPPPTHPFNPLLALRLASLPMPEADRDRWIDALFEGAWGGGGGCETAAQVMGAAERAGLDGARMVALAGEAAAKEALRQATDAALAAGVFGVPSFASGGEVFWGVDALPHLDDWLAGRDPVPADVSDRWADLRASAQRERKDPA